MRNFLAIFWHMKWNVIHNNNDDDDFSNYAHHQLTFCSGRVLPYSLSIFQSNHWVMVFILFTIWWTNIPCMEKSKSRNVEISSANISRTLTFFRKLLFGKRSMHDQINYIHSVGILHFLVIINGYYYYYEYKSQKENLHCYSMNIIVINWKFSQKNLWHRKFSCGGLCAVHHQVSGIQNE